MRLRLSRRYIVRGSSRRSWARCRCTGELLAGRLSELECACVLNMGSRGTYELEGNAASFHTTNSDVEEDARAL
jgi:hypothetical protein